ncbi:cation:proton antiporter [Nocardiopsis sp. NPDC050513]|uniref:cation:proton antiporter n=1 Tax=Nocardiopsis sp. NPDC050513 TaxID=3364338 RepID=UPI00378BBE47
MLTDLLGTITDDNLLLVVRVLPAVIVILATSALCGRLALLVGQPRVLGEMVAGILLGPTLLGLVLPGVEAALFPDQVKSVLYVLSTLGLTLFMFLVGAGLDHGGGKSGPTGRAAGVLAVSGVVPSLLLGAGAAWLFYGQLSRPDVHPLMFALFAGGALSITAFPMLARILYERGLQNSRLGVLTLIGASIDDAAAWCFLAVLSALHLGAGPGHALVTIGLTAMFAVFMLMIVARLLRPLGRSVRRTGRLGFDQLYVVLIVVLAAGLFTDLIGIYSVFGGFIAGLAMPRDAVFREALHSRMMDMVSVLLLPLFFTYSGLNTRLNGLMSWELILPFLALLVAGFVGKYFGCALAMRGIGHSWRESYAVGSLMNARGLMILIFINIGLSQQMITTEAFSIFVLIAVITTASAMPLYRLALPSRFERAVDGAPPPAAAATETAGTRGEAAALRSTAEAGSPAPSP